MPYNQGRGWKLYPNDAHAWTRDGHSTIPMMMGTTTTVATIRYCRQEGWKLRNRKRRWHSVTNVATLAAMKGLVAMQNEDMQGLVDARDEVLKNIIIVYSQASVRYASKMTDDLADGDTDDYDKHQAEGHAFYRVIEAYVAEHNTSNSDMIVAMFDPTNDGDASADYEADIRKGTACMGSLRDHRRGYRNTPIEWIRWQGAASPQHHFRFRNRPLSTTFKVCKRGKIGEHSGGDGRKRLALNLRN